MSDEAKTEVPPPSADDAGFKAALKRHNDDAYALARDAWERAERHRVEAEVLKSRVPAEGAAVFSADDAAVFAKYRDLGPFDDLSARLAERDQFAATIAAHERRKTIETAAASFGYDPDVLEVLPGADALEFEFIEAFHAGKKAKLAHVKNAEGKPVPLDKFAADRWPKLLPSLKAVVPTQPHRVPTVPVPPDPSLPTRPRRPLVR